jgi:hypothetical protein
MRLSRPTQRLGGLEVDEQLDLGDLLHRQVDRLIGGDHQGTCPVLEQDANVASNSRSRWSVDPATTVAAGTASCRISSRFGVTSTLRLDMPVRLPRANSIGWGRPGATRRALCQARGRRELVCPRSFSCHP